MQYEVEEKHTGVFLTETLGDRLYISNLNPCPNDRAC